MFYCVLWCVCVYVLSRDKGLDMWWDSLTGSEVASTISATPGIAAMNVGMPTDLCGSGETEKEHIPPPGPRPTNKRHFVIRLSLWLLIEAAKPEEATLSRIIVQFRHNMTFEDFTDMN